jgi:dephospho-CoA kinase
MSGPQVGATPRPLRIGLTGPIGCGKSTLARHLASRGGTIIDADELARAVTVPGAPALAAIRERFGDRVFGFGGVLERRALAEIVFSDPIALRDLEAIVHPAVRERIAAALAAATEKGVPFVVIEAIKLVEGGLATICDETWLVVCDRATQRGRLGGRGIDPADTERRLGAQGDIVERLSAVATRVLRTDGPLRAALAAVDAALDTALAARR